MRLTESRGSHAAIRARQGPGFTAILRRTPSSRCVARAAIERLGTSARWLSEEAQEFLAEHAWPGNVRELENAIKRALVLAAHDVLTPEDFAFLRSPQPGSAAAETGGTLTVGAGQAVITPAPKMPTSRPIATYPGLIAWLG